MAYLRKFEGEGLPLKPYVNTVVIKTPNKKTSLQANILWNCCGK